DARSSLLRSAQLAASPLGGLTPADVPLIEAEILSEQPGPPHPEANPYYCNGRARNLMHRAERCERFSGNAIR
ncbi:MAG: hypothetical protein WBX25_36050, partial [Rhodomicrobium sp.]